MPMYETDDRVDEIKRKNRNKRLVRLVIIVIILIAAVVIYITQEIWLPKLRGLGDQATTIVNDGRLAEGNFPIAINSGGVYQAECSGKILFVVSDSSIYLYSEEGGLIRQRQHAYSNVIMDAVAGKALLYESGGNRFSVEDRNGILYSKELPDNIIFVRLSKEGYTAVVTTSDDYECEIKVYNRDGDFIYKRKCVEMVSNISFTGESTGCVISSIYAENGSLVTSVQETLFSEENSKWTSPGLDTFGIEVCGYASGAAVIGVDACGYVDSGGNIISLYHYDGDMKGGSCEDGKSAVIINNDDIRKYSAALFDGSGGEPLLLTFEKPLVDVTVSGGLAYIMTQDSVLAYDFDGALRSTAQINDSYTGFLRGDGYVFLKGYGRIDRINYES